MEMMEALAKKQAVQHNHLKAMKFSSNYGHHAGVVEPTGPLAQLDADVARVCQLSR